MQLRLDLTNCIVSVKTHASRQLEAVGLRECTATSSVDNISDNIGGFIQIMAVETMALSLTSEGKSCVGLTHVFALYSFTLRKHSTVIVLHLSDR